jgi:hypothetical protein
MQIHNRQNRVASWTFANSANSYNPADLAREAIRWMAVTRIAPAPENFTRAYRAASGGSDRGDGSESEQVLGQLVSIITARRPDLGSTARLQEYVGNRAWNDALEIVREVINEALTATSREWPRLLQHPLLQLDRTHANWTRARKLITLKHVFATPSNDDRTRKKNLNDLSGAGQRSPRKIRPACQRRFYRQSMPTAKAQAAHLWV